MYINENSISHKDNYTEVNLYNFLNIVSNTGVAWLS